MKFEKLYFQKDRSLVMHHPHRVSSLEKLQHLPFQDYGVEKPIFSFQRDEKPLSFSWWFWADP